MLVGGLAIAVDIGVTRITYGVSLSAIRRDLHLGFFSAGVLASLQLAGYFAGNISVGWVAKRHSLAVICRYAHIVFAAALGWSAFSQSAIELGFARTLTGIATGFGVSTVFAIGLERAQPQERARLSAMMWSGIGVTIIASGLAVVPLEESRYGWRIAHIGAAMIALLVSVAFPAFHRPTPPVEPTSVARNAATAGDTPKTSLIFLTTSYFAFGAAFLSYITFAGTQLRAADASTRLTGAFWIAAGVSLIIGGAICAYALPRVSHKSKALAWVLALGAIGAVITRQGGAACVLSGGVFVGLGLAAIPAIVTAVVRERTHAAEYVQAFGVVTTWMAVGQMAGPALSGQLADLLGPAAVPVFSGAAYIAGAGLAWKDGRLTQAANERREAYA